jgi:plasmid stability protein
MSQRLEEIVKAAFHGLFEDAEDGVRAIVREALSSQEEELRKLRLDRDTYKLEFESYIERECACCPEDVGFDEFIKALQAKIGRQEEELRSLREERDDLLYVKAATAHARDLNQTRAREAEARAESAEAEVKRLSALQAKACSCICHEDGVAPILKFYADVNARAEADMLAGRPTTGAHHRALEAEIAAYRQEK